MAIAPRLDQRQSQALVMTPQLQQAIKLLQLSNLELLAYVEEELEQNPLLERDEDEGAGPDGAPANGAAADDREGWNEGGDGDPLTSLEKTLAADQPGSAETLLDMDDDEPADGERAANHGGVGAAAFEDWGGGGGRGFENPAPDLEQTVAGKESLRDHLMRQLNMDIADPGDRLIGLHLIDLLDEAGYISGDLAEIAAVLNCDRARVEATLAALQQFDPPGIFARTLAECLALQLRDRNRLDGTMQKLLDNLDLLGRSDLVALTRACGVDADALLALVAEIRTLDPKPALAFDHTLAQPITPDIIMRPHPDGGWIVELNNETLPRVLVNNHYFTRISRAARNKEEKHYINERFQSASWLVKSLHQRATTILKVAGEIVRQQHGFFANGVQHLRPLVLRDIAEVISMHESTVSRVTSNKYIATPRGIYELKYFFTPAIPSSRGGAAHSAEAVRHRIKALIEAESADDVYSDDRIVDILGGEGIDIARRTIAKYREALGVSSSVQRRRQKVSRL